MRTILILGAALLLFIGAAEAQVAVITNKSNSTSTMTTSQIASVYSLDMKTWPSGEKIVVLDNKGTAREKFYKYIGKSDSDLKKIWMRVQLSGNGKAPEGMNADDEVVAKVAATPGAIGFVNASAAGGTVKVIATIP
jgi:ABC-type phosphate transport system substrate-binding protein